MVMSPNKGVGRYAVPEKKDFRDEEGRGCDFIAAPELEEIAGNLIRTCGEFVHLRQIGIACLWRKEGGTNAGRDVLGKCTKASGMLKHYSGVTWLIWLAADHLRARECTGLQIEAVVYHELSHASVNEDFAPSVRGHDSECFVAEIRRYGAIWPSLEANQLAWQQAPLFDSEVIGGRMVAAAERLLGGPSVESVTISHEGRSATLTRETARNAERLLRRNGGGLREQVGDLLEEAGMVVDRETGVVTGPADRPAGE